MDIDRTPVWHRRPPMPGTAQGGDDRVPGVRPGDVDPVDRDGREELDFPIEFAEAVAGLQAAASRPDGRATGRTGGVFHSIHDLYLKRATDTGPGDGR